MSARRKLIAALTEASHGSIPALADVDHAENLVNAHRAEVLTEGAEILRGRVAQYPTRRIFAAGLRHAALVLAKAATGRGKSSREANATPEFFQPDHTYTDNNGYLAPELTRIFQVEHVTRHPDRGHLRAIGWMRSGETHSLWHGDFRDENEFRGWTDITLTGKDGA